MNVHYKEISDFFDNILPNLEEDKCIVNFSSVIHVYTKDPKDSANVLWIKTVDLIKDRADEISKAFLKNEHGYKYTMFRIIKGLGRVFDVPYVIETFPSDPSRIRMFYEEKLCGYYMEGVIEKGSTVENMSAATDLKNAIVPYIIIPRDKVLEELSKAAQESYKGDLKGKLLSL